MRVEDPGGRHQTSFYSARRIIAGSTLAARRAEIALAVKPSARTNAAATASVSGSDAMMPDRILRTLREIEHRSAEVRILRQQRREEMSVAAADVAYVRHAAEVIRVECLEDRACLGT